MLSPRFAYGLLLLITFSVAQMAHSGWAYAQPSLKKADIERVEKLRAEAAESLLTLSELLAARKEQAGGITKLKLSLRNAKEDATKKELETKIKAENGKLAQIDAQISALSTGVAEDDIKYDQSTKFDLKSELESLVQPFIKMMRDATENARQIDRLKSTIAVAEQRQQAATRANTRLGLLLSVDKANVDKKDAVTRKHLNTLVKTWVKREKEAQHLVETARQQLQLRIDQQANSPNGIGSFATRYFSDRGLNLLIGVGALFGVFLVMNLIARLAEYIRRRQGYRRSFATRLIGLIFRALTAAIAFLAMLTVFNIMNDWLLLGVASVFLVAGAWIGLKMLPQLIEQMTLLLDLGAVQENERVLLAGVPWRVQRLDLYTDLVNPALDGGTFTVPVRELVGLHSRPAAVGEAWFPTRKGDWVQLHDGQIGKVISQTPELVQIVELGGSRRTFETTAFLAEAPRNLSTGYRIKTEFGLDYRHQGIAVSEIPEKLKLHVRAGLTTLLGEDAIKNVDVDLLRADDSAIIFEIEVDIDGSEASRYEDIERAVAHLMVDAANTNGWSIPFPQMVLHRA
ncbi:MAG: hypothetical protein ACI89J_000594 [Hyphomicrobiaceae bacterium]|jgi:hypothetical protein